jgi:hypothetical protein
MGRNAEPGVNEGAAVFVEGSRHINGASTAQGGRSTVPAARPVRRSLGSPTRAANTRGQG